MTGNNAYKGLSTYGLNQSWLLVLGGHNIVAEGVNEYSRDE